MNACGCTLVYPEDTLSACHSELRMPVSGSGSNVSFETSSLKCVGPKAAPPRRCFGILCVTTSRIRVQSLKQTFSGRFRPQQGSRSCVDSMSRQRRSALMARIRSKNTSPEMMVRKLVSALGRRYRLHVRRLPGCPDLVFARDHKIIFVHGCFWHPHARCAEGHVPVSHRAYWRPKLEGNCQRDRRNQRRLRRAGWTLLTIRECELSDPERVANRLAVFLQRRNRQAPFGTASHGREGRM